MSRKEKEAVSMKSHSEPYNPDPFHLFREWYLEAVDSDISDPTIMTLATVGQNMRPSARIVLLKDFDQKGFVFYTNYKHIPNAQVHWHQ